MTRTIKFTAKELEDIKLRVQLFRPRILALDEEKIELRFSDWAEGEDVAEVLQDLVPGSKIAIKNLDDGNIVTLTK